MVEVNQDVLCDFCEGHFEGMSRDLCEGSRCGEATELYLEDNGIENGGKTFEGLTVGAVVYFIKTEGGLLEVEEFEIQLIKMTDNGNFSFHSKKGVFLLSLNGKLAKENKSDNYFIYKKDCNEKLKEICIERIIKLSEIIGDCK